MYIFNTRTVEYNTFIQYKNVLGPQAFFSIIIFEQISTLEHNLVFVIGLLHNLIVLNSIILTLDLMGHH